MSYPIYPRWFRVVESAARWAPGVLAGFVVGFTAWQLTRAQLGRAAIVLALALGLGVAAAIAAWFRRRLWG